MRNRFATSLLVICLGAPALFAQPARRPTVSNAVRQFVAVDTAILALTHVRVIDGTGAPARADQTLIIRDGRIASVGDAASTPIPRRRAGHGPHGQVRDPGTRARARAPVLPNGSGRIREPHRELHALVSRRRRHVDAHRRQHERLRRDQRQEIDRPRRARRPVDRRDRAVPRRPGARPRSGARADGRGRRADASSTSGTTWARRRSRRTCTSRATSSRPRSTKATSAG